MEGTDAWEVYAESFCFIDSFYYIDDNTEIPQEAVARADRLTYYRWMPVLLALAAFSFYFPNSLFSALHRRTGYSVYGGTVAVINPHGIVLKASEVSLLRGDDREKAVERLAALVVENLSAFSESTVETFLPHL